MKTSPFHRYWFLIANSLLIIILAACGPSQYTPRVWIDFPKDGSQFDEPQTFQVIAHAALKEGIGYVALSVDNTPLDQQKPKEAGALFSDFQFSWKPKGDGDYTLVLTVYDAKGVAQASTTSRVKIGKAVTFTPDISDTPTMTFTPTATATITSTITPTPTLTFTPSLTPSITNTPNLPINTKLVSDVSSVNVGDCAVLSWWVENADVVYFDGREVAATGSDGVCPTTTHTYLLRAERGSEYREESLTITVNTRDTTPPPVPQPQVPGNGLHADCKSNQTLAWLPVTDPSGVRGYDVEIQRKESGSWKSYQYYDSLKDKQVSLPVECNFEYRWRVRATDKEGNISAWSGWFTFVIDAGLY